MTKLKDPTTNRHELEQKGFSILSNFFSKQEIENLINLLESQQSKKSKVVESKNFRHIRSALKFEEQLKIFLAKLRFFEHMNQVCNMEVAVVTDEYICKKPGSDIPGVWHQDEAYYQDEKLLTAVIALDNLDENGGYAYVPGSHSTLAPHTLNNAKQLQVEGNLSEGLVFPLKAGDVLLLDSRTIHKGLSNDSSNNKRSYTIVAAPKNSPTIKSL
jgi:ectoine hydroxylase-related dioxygenase (phytanoyl-CoA dioxygenase family)